MFPQRWRKRQNRVRFLGNCFTWEVCGDLICLYFNDDDDKTSKEFVTECRNNMRLDDAVTTSRRDSFYPVHLYAIHISSSRSGLYRPLAGGGGGGGALDVGSSVRVVRLFTIEVTLDSIPGPTRFSEK
jgi:hypothetical protein